MVDYEHFLNQLRQKEASPLMDHFRGFLARFNSEKRPIMQQRKLVASFLSFIYGESLQNEIFAESAEDEELENIREGWEKLVMMNIYDQVFGGPGTDDLKMGATLHKKIETFQWLQESHLDLPFSFHHTLEIAQAEMLRVNGFRAPRDKLVILQNTTQLVVDLIKKASEENAGNDHLLPTLILTIVRANPPNLIGNIKYILRFRNQTELEKGPNQYCLTNLMSAVSFIYNMTPKSLTLTDEEKTKYGVSKDLPNRPDDGSPSSSGGQRTADGPQVSQLASKVYTQTSGWFNTLIREAKVFGEQAAGKVDGFVNQVMADSDEEEELQERESTNDFLAQSRHQGEWFMQPSPGVSPITPEGGHLPIEPVLPPRPATGRQPLSPANPAEVEDYELQLAMALSLSSMEEDKKRRVGETANLLGLEGSDEGTDRGNSPHNLVDVADEGEPATGNSSLGNEGSSATDAKPYVIPSDTDAQRDQSKTPPTITVASDPEDDVPLLPSSAKGKVEASPQKTVDGPSAGDEKVAEGASLI
ncbi:hypothetical protein DFS34DRAFT_514822 [Phlyctochytrium arcticum]|nr:hypothetical protein DFS34DRAFT_514822 [Phlyctochytrium arcticum]